MTTAADIPQTAILYILIPDIQRSVGNRSRHSSRLSGLQHLPSVVERATLIAHADMYYNTPKAYVLVFFSSNIGKGDAYIHIPRTSTVASPLTTCLDLLDSDRPKTRRLKTPFNMSLLVSHPMPALEDVQWQNSLARRGLSFAKLCQGHPTRTLALDNENRAQNYK